MPLSKKEVKKFIQLMEDRSRPKNITGKGDPEFTLPLKYVIGQILKFGPEECIQEENDKYNKKQKSTTIIEEAEELIEKMEEEKKELIEEKEIKDEQSKTSKGPRKAKTSKRTGNGSSKRS